MRLGIDQNFAKSREQSWLDEIGTDVASREQNRDSVTGALDTMNFETSLMK